jgi:hypothetical protein
MPGGSGVSDGSTSDILDTIEALRDCPPGDIGVTDTAALDALALFIERQGLEREAVLFLHRYFDGQERRLPFLGTPFIIESGVLTLEAARTDPARKLALDKVRIWSDEHRAWWGPEGRGYFTELTAAGVYDIEEAYRLTQHCCSKKKIQFHNATKGTT